MLVVDKIFGEYICVDCNKRFHEFLTGSTINKCPYCQSTNWYEYKIYKDLIKFGISIKKEKKQ